MVANRNPRRFIRTGIYGSTSDDSGSETSAVASCPSTNPPFICICNGNIVNKGQTNTPKFRETSELHNYIDIRLSNDSNALSTSSQILREKLSVSSRRNLLSRCRMDVAEETVEPMGPQLFIHGVPTIYTLNKNAGI